ncbi:MAG: MMPL family transporter [Microbacterium sp.]|uniref:MMPL family transporter n=1 Tax=Microbacterium sp. TaxID=51671 RepID=UPI00271D07CA|nr:MMPL family transporter [Microbacterium sp.]MDO8383855.1 MMPL family transporter [Microbacterium sp.]
MSSLLYRWGKLAYSRRWWVTGLWVLGLAAMVGVIVMNPPQLSNEIRIDGTPAQEVIDDLADRLPDASGGQGILAFHATDGDRIDEGDHLAALLASLDGVYGGEHVIDAREVIADELAKGPESLLLQASAAIAQAQAASGNALADAPTPLLVDQMPVPGVVVSADGETALFQFAFDAQTFELPEGTVSDTVKTAQDAVAGEGIEVLPSSTMIQIPELVGVGEVLGVVFAALVLVITLGSLVAAGLPLVSALSGVAVGIGGAFAISSIVPMHSLTAVLGLMLGLAVGIDYALFIVNRQRRFVLDQRLDAHEATARAIGTAGSAVFFAGTTVVIALLALTVVQIQLLTTMAITAAATVVIAVLSALTLLPALLGLVGERICSAKARLNAGTAQDNGSSHRIANAWSGFLVRRRYLAAIGSLVIAAAIAAPVLDMNLGLPSGASHGPDTPQRQSFEVVGDAFGDGYNGPLVVVATSPDNHTIPAAELAGIATDLADIDGVTAVSLGGLDDDGTTAVFSLVPETGPTDAATGDLVTAIRDAAPSFADDHGVDIGVTGFTALAIDLSDRLAAALPLYLTVVVGLSLIVLLLVFRSILVPIKATAGFLLSLAATFGATTAVFQWGWLQPVLGMDATAPVLSLLPIIITGVLYGLAMDYEVFLVSSMKEAHVHGITGSDAVTRGFAVASRVVVAAAIIMTSVFAGFIFNAEPMISQVGFALAFGIFVDAFLVRMTLVPAIMAVFGDRAWWLPRWLDRLLPDLDIEGDKLTTELIHK